MRACCTHTATYRQLDAFFFLTQSCVESDSYEKVKENEVVEALKERAETIVDMELLYPTGFPLGLLGKHKYAPFLHMLAKMDEGEAHEQPWQGPTPYASLPSVKEFCRGSQLRQCWSLCCAAVRVACCAVLLFALSQGITGRMKQLLKEKCVTAEQLQ